MWHLIFRISAYEIVKRCKMICMSYDKQPKENLMLHSERKCEEKNEKLKTHNALFILVVKHLLILKGIL